jgi:hypothetical protein
MLTHALTILGVEKNPKPRTLWQHNPYGIASGGSEPAPETVTDQNTAPTTSTGINLTFPEPPV